MFKINKVARECLKINDSQKDDTQSKNTWKNDFLIKKCQKIIQESALNKYHQNMWKDRDSGYKDLKPM